MQNMLIRLARTIFAPVHFVICIKFHNSGAVSQTHIHEHIPIKYSNIMFQPMTKATNSPTVTYEYMYAEPDVCGTRTPNSA